jgi:hypothetical protein
MNTDFMLPFAFQEQKKLVNYMHPVLLLGSCFSDEIAQKFAYSGFHVDSNPMGTLFHPLPIARFLDFCCTNNSFPQGHLIERNSRFSSWEASTSVNFHSSNELLDYIEQVKSIWNDRLKNASHLFLTFGSAWGYEREGYGIVANCHKFPSTNFVKKLLQAEEIITVFDALLKKINTQFPQLTVVFTVSPVRHVRDGLIENNRSKAELIKAVHELVQKNECASYFPSYEFIIDVLRDYRFFKRDRVHPSDEAVDCIWNELLNAFATEEMRELTEKVNRFRKMEQHRPLSTDEKAINLWKNKLEEEKKRLLTAIPNLNLS